MSVELSLFVLTYRTKSRTTSRAEGLDASNDNCPHHNAFRCLLKGFYLLFLLFLNLFSPHEYVNNFFYTKNEPCREKNGDAPFGCAVAVHDKAKQQLSKVLMFGAFKIWFIDANIPTRTHKRTHIHTIPYTYTHLKP